MPKPPWPPIMGGPDTQHGNCNSETETRMNEFGIGTLVFIMLLFGGAPIGYGLLDVTASNGPVTCGGEVMHTDSTCHLTRNGSGDGSKSYDQMKAEQAPSTGKIVWGVVMILFGTAVTIGCIRGIRNRIRERRQGSAQ